MGNSAWACILLVLNFLGAGIHHRRIGHRQNRGIPHIHNDNGAPFHFEFVHTRFDNLLREILDVLVNGQTYVLPIFYIGRLFFSNRNTHTIGTNFVGTLTVHARKIFFKDALNAYR